MIKKAVDRGSDRCWISVSAILELHQQEGTSRFARGMQVIDLSEQNEHIIMIWEGQAGGLQQVAWEERGFISKALLDK